MKHKVVGVAAGPHEGWITVVCDDGAVFIGLDGRAALSWEPEKGRWLKATPIPGTDAVGVEPESEGQ